MKRIVARAEVEPCEPGLRARLQTELALRCQENRHYSLRAFALDLGVDHSSLSQLIRGLRVAGTALIARFGDRLGWTADEVDRIARHEAGRAAGATTRSESTVTTRYALEVLADPLHFTLLELVRLRQFQPDFRWIARVLDVTVDDVALAVQRLLHLGLLEMTSPTTWRDTAGTTVLELEDRERSLRERTIARLQLWERSDSGPFVTATIALSERRSREARVRLLRFQEQFLHWLASPDDEPRDRLERLTIRLASVLNSNLDKERDDGRPRGALSDDLESTG
jgi:hypothetical protein